MRRTYILLLLNLAELALCAPLPQYNVQTGIVPIFDSRITNEPITFTFTTQSPNYDETKATQFPTLRPNTYVSFEPVLHNNINSYNVNEQWQKLQAMEKSTADIENTIKQNKMVQAPIYNQAQYFKAMQSLSQQLPSPTFPTDPQTTVESLPSILLRRPDYAQFWNSIKTSWQQVQNKAQDNLRKSGAEADWSRLFHKLNGAFEPFMSKIGEHIGRAMSIFLKNQQTIARKQAANLEHNTANINGPSS